MKLCRFELIESPGDIRSGLYFDGRFYETDGQNAIGIHDPGQVRLYPPLGQPPAIRLFDQAFDQDGRAWTYYSYTNPTVLHGPNSEVTLPESGDKWDFEVRVCGVIGARGEQIDPIEAPTFVLGYALMIVMTTPDTALEARLGGMAAIQRDFAISVGPFLVTPDELAEAAGEAPLSFRWRYEIWVNDVVVAKGINESALSFADLLGIASQNHQVQPGEILAWPPLEKQPIDLTALGRTILPTDKVQVKTEALGILVARLA